MSIRPLKLPDDLLIIADLVGNIFQYPENEQWSLQADDKVIIARSLKKWRMMWPLIELTRLISPQLKDMIRGFVWEEQGNVAGIILIHRIVSTRTWIIQTMGVLPRYRKRGIARELMNAGLNFIFENRGKRAFLVVIDGNLPACNLYKSLGFVDYSYLCRFRLTPEKLTALPSLSSKYSQSAYNQYDWKVRYEFIRRITPQNITRYEPLYINRFRMPAMARLLKPLVMFVQGSKETGINLRTAGTDKVVAQASYQIEQNSKKKIGFSLRLDPEYPDLSSYLFRYLIYQASIINQNCRIEFSVPGWMKSLISTAEQVGAVQLFQLKKMGLIFSNR